MSDTTVTRLVSFRVDKDLKSTLETIALDSDRSLTQLCRYALSAFLLSDVSVADLDIVDGREDDTKLTELIGVRLSVELLDEISATAGDISTSGLVRGIVSWWVQHADRKDLGTPVAPRKAGRANDE